MTTMLAIETSTDVCSVALSRDGRVLCCVTLQQPRRHAEQLIPMARAALDAADIDPLELQAVAVSAGPGSYTGLRIGVSTAKGIAVAVDARFIPVSSLEALAEAGEFIADSLVLTAFRSRREEVYAALWQIAADARPRPMGGPVAGSPDDVLRKLDLGDDCPVVIGDGAGRLARTLAASDRPHLLETRVRPSASAVVRLAQWHAPLGSPVDVEQFEPYYLRDFVARPAAGSAFDRLPF